ncbi:ArnT family glycosyltransferase [Hymenobacter sp. HDW8]|uniref:ArnT family glycosyltransferase n=1 Tax=Hymenobacter sp. HDW8 TaxID=2714932 RepID=UPI00140AB997|nr:glycosyltransferase family 39 protein [Hymenobacter sp. HDW8]QIL77069.1 hypothetical protein G7064_15335 [Hymenobacter sp. HDW8]
MINKLLPARHQRLIVGSFFGLLVLLGLLLHRDYGVSADEANNHLNGLVSAKYLAQLVAPELVARQASSHLIPDIRTFADADHGVAFELPLALLSFVFTHGNSQAFYHLRHFCVFLVFLVGVWALYRLATLRWRDWRLGLVSAGLLVLSPRFFAESFYNGKDIVYMALFTLAMYTLTRLLQRPTVGRVLVHGLATALAVDVRVQGLLLVLMSGLLLGLEAYYRPRVERHTQGWVSAAALYVVAALGLTVLGWPYLWALSWDELLAATQRISQYPWRGSVLYLGHAYRVPTEHLPWHYIPVWIVVTTPVTYTLAAAGGLFLIARRLLGQWPGYFRTAEHRFDLLLLLWLFVPLFLVMALNSVVYNGWRHLYFVYPAFILLAIGGLRHIYFLTQHHSKVLALTATLVLVATGLEVAYTGMRMVKAHPHQYVYFSFLPPTTAERLFELDYWGLSYRQGLDWVLAHDASTQITFSGNPGYLNNNMLILPPSQRARLHYIPSSIPETPTKARYFLTAYHYYGARPKTYPDSLGREVYTIRADGLRIFSVFKRW